MESQTLSSLAQKRELGGRMLLDYIFMTTWDEFKQSHEINYESSRDIVQGVLRQSEKRSSDDTIKHHLLLLMCRLSDGNDYSIQYNPTLDNTMLEEALLVIKNVLEYYPALKGEGACIIRQIKVQAVFVCCRMNDFKAAKEVCNRLWKDSSVLDKISHKLVEDVLKSEDAHCPQLEEHCYDAFLSQIVEFLGKITETFTQPFIDQAAEEYNTYVDRVQKKKRHNEDKVFKASMIASVADFMGVDDGEVVTKTENDTFHKKIQVIRDKVKKEEVEHQTAFLTAARSLNSYKTIRPVESHVDRYAKRQRNSPQTRVSQDEELSGSSDEENKVKSTVPLHLRMRTSLSSVSTLIRRQRMPWTKEEEKNLTLGVKKFGKGNWAQILEHYAFSSRTTVHLKDKWRNMEKQ